MLERGPQESGPRDEHRKESGRGSLWDSRRPGRARGHQLIHPEVIEAPAAQGRGGGNYVSVPEVPRTLSSRAGGTREGLEQQHHELIK